MASITELQEKVELLQTALDAEQEQVAAAIAGLRASIVELEAILNDGGTEAQRQELLDKLDGIIVDLQGTVE